MPNIKLQSSDKVTFEVDTEVAKFIGTIKAMIENLGMTEEEEVIPIPNVKAAILSKIITWATYHSKVDNPETAQGEGQDDGNLELEMHIDLICSWDKEFLKVDQETLYELVLASNYLDIKGLLEITTKTVGHMIRDKTAQQIRDMFNITNDFTVAEEAQIREENEWCDEN